MQIVPLFSVPVFYALESERTLTETEASIIRNLETAEGNPNNLSLDTKVLDIPELVNLKHFCEKAILNYARTVCGVVDEFYITNSWTARNPQGQGHARHSHPNSIFSGVYYVDADENTAPLILHGHSPIFKNFLLEYHYERYGIFNSNDWAFPVRSGSLIIFPSWVDHSSGINESSVDRRILGFNSFVKGNFGNQNYCSDLTIS
jgi:uncharacterized protein (TIGR02466 family)